MAASYEPMLDIYTKLALVYGVPVRPIAPLSQNPVYGGDFVVDKIINQRLRNNGIKMVDHNIFDLFFNHENSIQSFITVIKSISDDKVIEAMFHPAIGNNAEDWRQSDLSTIISKELMTFIQTEKIKLINYTQI